MIRFHLPTKIIFTGLGVMLLAGGIFILVKYPSLKKQQTVNNTQPVGSAPVGNSEISITSPAKDAAIKSPLHITGKAKGSWFFEATFPVTVLDSNGQALGTAPAKAQGDWQTQDFVNFSVNLNFNLPKGTKGSIRFENDNPSGLSQNQKVFVMPVTFSTAVSEGKCSPNLVACAGDPKTCLNNDENAVCVN